MIFHSSIFLNKPKLIPINVSPKQPKRDNSAIQFQLVNQSVNHAVSSFIMPTHYSYYSSVSVLALCFSLIMYAISSASTGG